MQLLSIRSSQSCPSHMAAVTSLALDGSLENLYIGTTKGLVVHVALSDQELPTVKGGYVVTAPTTAVTALGFLNGDRSLVVMTAAGEVSAWGLIRHAEDQSRWRLTKMHTFRPHGAPVTAFAPSQRVKGFVTADAKGQIFLHHATSEQTWLKLSNGDSPIRAVTFAPKGDGLISLDAAGQLALYQAGQCLP